MDLRHQTAHLSRMPERMAMLRFSVAKFKTDKFSAADSFLVFLSEWIDFLASLFSTFRIMLRSAAVPNKPYFLCVWKQKSPMVAESRAREFLGILRIRMKDMVGTTGLEPATSTVSRFA
jgi:hypothetical protein